MKPGERKVRTIKIEHHGIHEETLTVNGDVTDVLASGLGRVWAEAVVRLVDAEGQEWSGSAHIEITLRKVNLWGQGR